MLSDRSYMRPDPYRPSRPLVVWMIAVLAAVFVLQQVMAVAFRQGGLLEHYAALSVEGIRHGFFWTLISYALLHGGVLHLVLNALGLFFFGREMETVSGRAGLLGLTLLSALMGGLAWLAVNHHASPGAGVVGISAVVMALITAFALRDPNRPITFLVFFILPVTLRAFWLLIIVGAIGLFGLIGEIQGTGDGIHVAHSAHLGGLLAGWIYHRVATRSVRLFSLGAPAIEPPKWVKKPAAKAVAAAPQMVNLAPQEEDLRAKVDRILDKINSEGFAALTADEKRILNEAKDLLSRR